MTGVRWSRVFWIGAAAILIAAALIAVAAILRGDFGETEAQILGTLLALLVAGATGISGLALVERREVPTLGWVAVGGAALCFVLQRGGDLGRVLQRHADEAGRRARWRSCWRSC